MVKVENVFDYLDALRSTENYYYSHDMQAELDKEFLNKKLEPIKLSGVLHDDVIITECKINEAFDITFKVQSENLNKENAILRAEVFAHRVRLNKQ